MRDLRHTVRINHCNYCMGRKEAKESARAQTRIKGGGFDAPVDQMQMRDEWKDGIMEGMDELTRMIAVCENARAAKEELSKNTRNAARVDPMNNKKKQVVALMEAAGLSGARIKEHLDLLEK